MTDSSPWFNIIIHCPFINNLCVVKENALIKFSDVPELEGLRAPQSTGLKFRIIQANQRDQFSMENPMFRKE